MVKKFSARILIQFMVLLGLATGTLHKAVEATLNAYHSPACLHLKTHGRMEVFVTVSSVCMKERDGEIVDRQLEINWYGPKATPGDRVGLYNKDPAVGDNFKEPLVSVDPTEHPDGYFRTSVEFPFVYFNISTISKDSCLGYWVGYLSNGYLGSSACLQTRPFWMEENKKYLEHFTLSHIMIPGSHDSGSFKRSLKSVHSIVDRYKYAQEEPIFNQLVYGLRYFDFRVGYYSDKKEKFFINHSYFSTDHSIIRILNEVVKFLEATKEIVILDFHNFPVGFDSMEIHDELKALIINKLGPYMASNPENSTELTMGQLWKSGKRVIVSYGLYLPTQSHLLWPPIPRAWGDKQHLGDLKKYFMGIFSGPLPKAPFAAMAELTPNARTVILHPRQGLRVFADEVNRNITRWFRDLFWQRANIVATDYFLGNDIIDVAIETNKVKSLCRKIEIEKHKKLPLKANYVIANR